MLMFFGVSENMFPKAAQRLCRHPVAQKRTLPGSRRPGWTIALNVCVGGHRLSLRRLPCSPDPPRAMDVRITPSERGADRLHNALLANLFGESWALFATPLPLVSIPYVGFPRLPLGP
jgi:hypothetical protein